MLRRVVGDSAGAGEPNLAEEGVDADLHHFAASSLRWRSASSRVSSPPTAAIARE